jgi:predicted transcriptional regulator
MKTATFPSLRVDPALRQAAEDVLHEGESLSGFVEHAVRAQIELRTSQEAFIARGLASRDNAKRTGVYYGAGEVVNELKRSLALAQAEADQ